MKNKIIFTLLIMLLLIATILPVVKATDVINLNDYNNNTETIMNLTEKDVYEAKESILKTNETIVGNVYLFANDVTIENEEIIGDVFICANTVTIKEKAVISGNIYISALNAKIAGHIQRGLNVVAKDVILEKNLLVEYDANILAEHIKLSGNFSRNINACIDTMEVQEDGYILGDLNYASDKEATINDKAVINNINFARQIEEKETIMETVVRYVLNFVRFFVLTMILFILMIKFAPKFLEKSKEHLGISSFGIGILELILIPMLFVLLLMLSITIKLAIILAVLFILLLLISNAITVISIARKLDEKSEKLKLPIIVALVTLITWIIFKIPFIGAIAQFFTITTGLGIILKYQFIKK